MRDMSRYLQRAIGTQIYVLGKYKYHYHIFQNVALCHNPVMSMMSCGSDFPKIRGLKGILHGIIVKSAADLQTFVAEPRCHISTDKYNYVCLKVMSNNIKMSIVGH